MNHLSQLKIKDEDIITIKENCKGTVVFYDAGGHYNRPLRKLANGRLATRWKRR